MSKPCINCISYFEFINIRRRNITGVGRGLTTICTLANGITAVPLGIHAVAMVTLTTGASSITWGPGGSIATRRNPATPCLATTAERVMIEVRKFYLEDFIQIFIHEAKASGKI